MSAQAFAASLESWHDFYLAVGSASAALLGLLFVGVSINLGQVAAAARPDLRTRANLAFSNLLYLLGVSLVVLIPGSDPSTVAISFGVIAVLGLVRTTRHALGLRRMKDGALGGRSMVRSLGWTVAADVVLAYVAVQIASTGDGGYVRVTPIVVGVLLLGAADAAWDLLVRESEAP